MALDEREQTQILKEILKWTRFAGMRQVKSTLMDSLKTPGERLAYQLSDGTRGTVEVGKISGVGAKDKISDLWKDWFNQGVGEFIPVKGGDRFKRSFDLNDFKIDFPKMSSQPQFVQPEIHPEAEGERQSA